MQIVLIKSRGTLDNLCKHIDHEKSIKQTLEKDFINDINDKETTIIADDPRKGMGKLLV
ncbi:hypothetical protein [Rickettsia canadensis]|uniref:Uncharacterized protein n=1 Tax=Rickettsia canadensis str. CA410 TaxID=1105107 RepID=A0ABM5MRF1_RICCA|nr:hypothetical protein [Rickettsia canadensis]AFB21064.1 hypothetical protein RCA_02455 [Rickettsia canadensis str. CA410]